MISNAFLTVGGFQPPNVPRLRRGQVLPRGLRRRGKAAIPPAARSPGAFAVSVHQDPVWVPGPWLAFVFPASFARPIPPAAAPPRCGARRRGR